MSIQSEAATRFQRDAIKRVDAVTGRVLRLWQRVSVDDLDAGWATVEADMVSAVSTVAVQNAASSGRMVASVGRADGVAAADVIVPNAFTGIDGSGRASAGLLFGAVTTTKERIGAGMGARQAFLVGASYLAAMSKTMVADLSRSAALTASTGRNYTRYVRVVSPGACERCAILAGSTRFSKPFERHPACKCTSVPVSDGSIPDGLFDSPAAYFRSLSESEQDRIFTKSGAEAIRLGADPVQVVGARRGASGMAYSRAYPARPGQVRSMQRVQIGSKPDGSPILGYTTIEGTSRRGVYGRESFGRTRLMPETILQMTDDIETRRLLLRDAGYLESPVNKSSNDWIVKRLQQQQLDRVAADTFYRSLGIDLY